MPFSKMPSINKIACGIFVAIVALLLVIGSVLIGLAYAGHIWSETTGNFTILIFIKIEFQTSKFSVNVDGMKYDILHTSFGSTFQEAMELCQDRNMKVFEPRDAVIYHKVMTMITADWKQHWINIKREDASKQ